MQPLLFTWTSRGNTLPLDTSMLPVCRRNTSRVTWKITLSARIKECAWLRSSWVRKSPTKQRHATSITTWTIFTLVASGTSNIVLLLIASRWAVTVPCGGGIFILWEYGRSLTVTFTSKPANAQQSILLIGRLLRRSRQSHQSRRTLVLCQPQARPGPIRSLAVHFLYLHLGSAAVCLHLCLLSGLNLFSPAS